MMPEKLIRDLNAQIRKIKELTEDIEVLAMEEFDKNFDRQGFFVEGGWKPSKRVIKEGGGTTLVNRGFLRGGIKSESRPGVVKISVLGVTEDYANALNEGFAGRVTQTVKPSKNKGGKFKAFKGKEHKRSTNVKFEREKTTTRVLNMKLPKRQFIGSHPYLTKKIETLILKKIDMD